MNHPDRKPGLDSLSPVMLLLPPLGATALLWGLSTVPLQTFAGFCAFLLLAAPWGSYLLWLRQNRGGIPLFAMISGMYWIYFVPMAHVLPSDYCPVLMVCDPIASIRSGTLVEQPSGYHVSERAALPENRMMRSPGCIVTRSPSTVV